MPSTGVFLHRLPECPIDILLKLRQHRLILRPAPPELVLTGGQLSLQILDPLEQILDLSVHAVCLLRVLHPQAVKLCIEVIDLELHFALDGDAVLLQLADERVLLGELGLLLVDDHCCLVEVIDEVGVLAAEFVDLVLHVEELLLQISLLGLKIVDQLLVLPVQNLS